MFRFLHPDTVGRHPDPGGARRADVRHALALERLDRAGDPAEPRRPQGAAADPAHAGRGPAGRGLPRCRRLPGEHPGRPGDPRPSAGAADHRDCLHEAMDIDGLVSACCAGSRRARSAASPATCRSRRRSRTRSSTPSPTRSSTTRRWRSAAPRPSTRAAPGARLRRRPRRAGRRRHRARAGRGLARGARRRRAARRPAHVRLPHRGRGQRRPRGRGVARLVAELVEARRARAAAAGGRPSGPLGRGGAPGRAAPQLARRGLARGGGTRAVPRPARHAGPGDRGAARGAARARPRSRPRPR